MGLFQQLTTPQIVGVVIGSSLLLEASCYFLLWLTKSDKKRRICETLFFPDDNPTCKEHYTSRHGCTAKYCSFSHDETSFYKLMKYLSSARQTLDLCVFVFTSAEMRDLVISLQSKGVRVRLITDKEQEGAQGSAVSRFRAEGIVVRHNNNSYFMHHKFAIVDGMLLINGSFNWTRQAITGNHENLVITDDQRIVKPYRGQFEQLWELFDRRAS